jgi:hypothetical protein
VLLRRRARSSASLRRLSAPQKFPLMPRSGRPVVVERTYRSGHTRRHAAARRSRERYVRSATKLRPDLPRSARRQSASYRRQWASSDFRTDWKVSRNGPENSVKPCQSLSTLGHPLPAFAQVSDQVSEAPSIEVNCCRRWERLRRVVGSSPTGGAKEGLCPGQMSRQGPSDFEPCGTHPRRADPAGRRGHPQPRSARPVRSASGDEELASTQVDIWLLST